MFNQGSTSEATSSSVNTYQIIRDEEFARFFESELNKLSASQQHVSTYIPLDPPASYSNKEQLEEILKAPYYGRNQSEHPISCVIHRHHFN